MRDPVPNPRLPPLLRWGYTVLVALLLPIYWVLAGPQNLLWFCDIALIVTLVTVWTGHALLASMMALSVTLVELVWSIDFLGALLLGGRLFGLTGYMFDPAISLTMRICSGVFHLTLVILLPWLVWRLGYDRRALPCQTVLAWLVLPLSYLASTPEQNLNWTHGLGRSEQQFLPDAVYVLLLMAALPVVLYLPTHLVLRRLFRAAGRAQDLPPNTPKAPNGAGQV